MYHFSCGGTEKEVHIVEAGSKPMMVLLIWIPSIFSFSPFYPIPHLKDLSWLLEHLRSSPNIHLRRNVEQFTFCPYAGIKKILESCVCLCRLNSMAGSVSALEQHRGGKKQTGVNNSIQMDVWESLRSKWIPGDPDGCLRVPETTQDPPWGLSQSEEDGKDEVHIWERWRHHHMWLLGNTMEVCSLATSSALFGELKEGDGKVGWTFW